MNYSKFFTLLFLSSSLLLTSCNKEEVDSRLDLTGIYEGKQECDQLTGNIVHVARASFDDQLVLSFHVNTWPGVLVVLNDQCDTATMEITGLEDGLRARGQFVFQEKRMTGYLDFLDGDSCKYDMILME